MKQRPFCDQRPSMKTNKLLVRAKVGKVVDTTYDLPPKEYRYGYQAHDDHGVAECLKWPNFTTSTSKQRAQSTRRERTTLQDEYNEETGSVTSRNIRRHYDGYDPRNPERFGFDEELCTSKIDPLVLYGPSVAITPEAAKAAVGNISPLGTVVPHPKISPENMSTTSYSSLYSTRRRNENDSGSDGEYESTYGQLKTTRKNKSKNTIRTRGFDNSFDATSATSYRTDCTAIQSPTRIKQPTGMKRIKKNANRDYIETNKQALRAGCCTAREFDEFKQTHEINVKPEENFKTQEDEYLRVLHKQMVHGIPTPPLTGVKDCLNWAGYKEAKQKAIERRERQKERKAKNASLKPKGIHYTRAARGHSHKPDPPPSYADTFKMKRFTNIDHYAIKDYWGDKPPTRSKVSLDTTNNSYQDY